MASSSFSLYEVLGISVAATSHEIKAAYRNLARTCHPDVVAIHQRDTSANEFMKINAAYSTLSDPNKRAVYDRNLFMMRQGVRSFSATAASMSSKSVYSGRNWETDQCW